MSKRALLVCVIPPISAERWQRGAGLWNRREGWNQRAQVNTRLSAGVGLILQIPTAE